MKFIARLKMVWVLVAGLLGGAAGAVPLATFDMATGGNYVNFPINDEDIAKGPFTAAGTISFARPVSKLSALGQSYVYDHSLVAYFDFFYSFTGDHGEFVDGQSFSILFDSPADYIELGTIPWSGLALLQTFDGQALINAFRDRFHGLWDNSWSITGFRASVRHIYQVPEPSPVFLLPFGLLAAMFLRRIDARREGSLR